VVGGPWVMVSSHSIDPESPLDLLWHNSHAVSSRVSSGRGSVDGRHPAPLTVIPVRPYPAPQESVARPA
jgi:hypothetical protein